jgi:D-arabinose 1-dehydrogenase-like Zn-dependent alcohol dehydrogenase
VKAARLHALGGALVVEELPDPAPGAGEVLVAVAACGIGLTVVHYCSEGLLGPHELPRTPGHELVGTIREVGAGVDPRRVGEKVLGYFYLVCGECRACLAGSDQLCERFVGTVGLAIDGGYAELAVLPAANAIRLVDGLDPVEATVIPDAVATPVHVARRAAIAPGERVAVIGAGGGVGIHMIQVARAFGGEPLALDLDAAKLAYIAEELGVPGLAGGVLDEAALPASWGGRADVVVDFAGSAEGLASALELLAPGGRLVCLTGHTGEAVHALSRELVFRQLSVLGSRYATRAELDLAARLLAAGRVRPVISARVGLDGVEAVHERLRRGELLGRGVLVP